MALTTIQWTQRQRPDGSWMPGYTFNPWWGCVEISPACDHCYAKAWAKRTGFDVWGAHAPRRWFGDKHWNEPVRWNKAAAARGEQHLVFCASMADVFEELKTDPEIGAQLDKERARLFQLIEATPNLTWLLLTKRPHNVMAMVPAAWRDGWFPENVWMGATAEDQKQLDIRLPHLVQIPVGVRFLSMEPLLMRMPKPGDAAIGLLGTAPKDWGKGYTLVGNLIHWVIVGGESGAKARPFELDVARSIVAECFRAGVPCFVKQLGARPLVEMAPTGRFRTFEGRRQFELEAKFLKLKDTAGGDPSEWPKDLRVREFPEAS